MPESLQIIVVVLLALFGVTWAWNRWISPRLRRRWLEKTIAKIQAGDCIPPVKRSDSALSFDVTGIFVSRSRPHSAPLYSLAWSEIVRVVAFKRDLGVVDCICLAFDTADGMTTELNEEMEGWEPLTEALATYLEGSIAPREWFCRVAFPAFAANETVIFERKSEMSKAAAD
jgi:hypothetical protein